MSDYLSQWEFDVTPILSTLTAFAVFFFGLKIVKIIFYEDRIPKDSVHNWKNLSSNQGAFCCSECKQLLIEGDRKYCDCCGIYAEQSCIKILNKKVACKAISLNNKDPMKHHWVKGNLKPLSICAVCEKECLPSAQLKHYKCCWCLKTVHEKCKPNIAEICDFGCYKSLIIPPMSVEVVSKRNSFRKVTVIKSVKEVQAEDWTPLLILGNCKSGSKEGEEILSKFRGLLNPAQIIDLGKTKPEIALKWCVLLGKIPFKILVAGGDGTVGWVLNTVEKLQISDHTALGIIPLGTGNDLSRVLGWGKGSSSNLIATSLLDDLLKAKAIPFDRWKVEIKLLGSFSFHSISKELFMYNYLSIGVDAQVTLDFHHTRESSPFYLFSNRLFNKLLYLSYGTQQLIEKKCQNLQEKIELYLDGKKIDLPYIESIVVLNIDSWGAGVNLWKMNKAEEDLSDQCYNDGKVEVLAIYSSLHIAQLQMGLGEPYRIGQANFVEIRLKTSCAVQVDGEPWFQHPATFYINHYNQALMLKKV